MQCQLRRREGAHSGHSEDAGPALDPSCTCSGPERRREAGRTVPCQVAEEGGSFSTKAPAYLDPKNDEARARELGVSLVEPNKSRKIFFFSTPLFASAENGPRQQLRLRYG